ncbi:MAG: FAD-binding oxidoreductase, partial [Deltaproteobacteria bacterium]|nr:FAD-binding oxidoreductase [Deltaproteobacteria bacterium]
ACAAAIAAARCASSRAAAIATTAADAWRVVVELSGDAPTVERDLARLRDEYGASETDCAAVEQICALQLEVPAPLGLRFRLGALPSRLESTLLELRAGGASLLAYPRLQLVYAGFSLGDSPHDADVERIFRAVESAALAAGGSHVCEAAPSSVKAGRDMFGDLGASGAIARALKRRFDPTGVLNPGRFAGRN